MIIACVIVSVLALALFLVASVGAYMMGEDSQWRS